MKIKAKVIEKLKNKNEDAFNEIYYVYYKLIYYIIYTLVNDQQLSEDLMQEAFIKMYQNINKLNDNDKFHSWFIKLTKNIVYNHLKSHQNKIEYNDEFIQNYPDQSYSVKPPQFDFNSMLNDFENYVITLHLIYNLTFNEIAEETGQTMSVVTKAYYKAIKKLKKIY